jgi:prevent-host-death family protein
VAVIDFSREGIRMEIINIHDAKTNFSRLIESVARGNEIVIAKAGKPAARLVPIAPPKIIRKPGALKGRIRVAHDFDAPLDDSLLAEFGVIDAIAP